MNQECARQDIQVRDVLHASLFNSAKTSRHIGVMEHLSHVLQVCLYLAERLDLPADEKNRVCLAAATHDLGKAFTRPENGRWVHAPQSAATLEAALSDPAFAAALREAGLVPTVDAEERGRIEEIVRDHHRLSARTLLHTPSAPLVLVADALASALEDGYAGRISDILSASRYHASAQSFLMVNGWAGFENAEVRKISLPSDTISDLMLSEIVVERITAELERGGGRIVMRDAGTLWVEGPAGLLPRLLDLETGIDDVLDPVVLEHVYGRDAMPNVPLYSVETMDYLLTSDAVARQVLRALFTRAGLEKTAVLERWSLTWDVLTAGLGADVMMPPEDLVAHLYRGIRRALVARIPEAESFLLPEATDLIDMGRGPAQRQQAEALRKMKVAAPDLTDDIYTLHRFITVSNGGRSILNVLYARAAIEARRASGRATFRLRDVALLDERPLADDPPVLSRTKKQYRTPCASCGLREARVPATVLVMGATEGDGLWASVGVRRKTQICAWCHLAGIADLPIASLRKRGTRHVRETNYLLVRSILPRESLARVLETLGLAPGGHAAPPSEEETALDVRDEALFTELLGHVPDPTDVLKVGGALGVLRGRGLHARMLPGTVPLASRCVFALPAAAFFGMQSTGELPQDVLDMISLGIIATLSEVLGPATFSLRTTSTHGKTMISSADVGARSLSAGRAAWRLAEIRRKLARRLPSLQSADALDIGFAIRLRQDPRGAAGRLLREIRTGYQPGSNRIAREVVALARTLAPDRDQTTRALSNLVRALIDAGHIRRQRGLFRATARKVWKARTEQDLMGPLHAVWKTRTLADLVAHLQNFQDPTGGVAASIAALERLASSSEAERILLRRINREALLLVLDAQESIASLRTDLAPASAAG